ncbi:MAG: hypothetical protein OEY51_13000, partial [Cyclobacteriaceae bacterium]|nr:hypothetical protein [Cyclobacteriaceae bacterium]
HSTDKHTLLVADFPEGSYAAAEVNNFILCFMCHSPGLFQDKETESGTNFRDGKKNLHFTHVNGQKGRNCTMCHNVHGSKAVKLIAENVKFGNWDMPIKYTPNEKGGSCQPGCHEKKTYTRTGPAMTGMNETNK